jgi:hypothetical protein
MIALSVWANVWNREEEAGQRALTATLNVCGYIFVYLCIVQAGEHNGLEFSAAEMPLHMDPVLTYVAVL